MKGTRWIILALFLTASAAVMAQTVPGMINYQGRLFDGTGQPVNEAALAMDFSLWDKGVTLEDVTDEIAVMNGASAISLAHRDITDGSEVVTAVGGSPTYESPRDYLMDYANGTITRVASGFILDGQSVEVDYEWTDFGSEIWSETQAVEVVNGLYQVRLGEYSALEASLLSSSTIYLEVEANMEVLSPRQRLTSVPFAMKADEALTLDGHSLSAFSLVGHTHNFTEIFGQATDAQIPDNITVVYAQDSGQLGGQAPAAYVSSSGDTITGPLDVGGEVNLGHDLIVQGDASILGGNIGLGREWHSNVGIINEQTTAPTHGALLYGTSYGVYGNLASDPSNHYGFLGSSSYGAFGRSGASTETSSQYGGFFQGSGQSNVYGAYGGSYGYGPGNSYGVYGYGYNDGSGNAYGGYFSMSDAGTGTHYGVFASVNHDYAAWFQGGRVHVGTYGTEDYVDGDGDLYVEDDLEVDNNLLLANDAYIGNYLSVGDDAYIIGGNLGLGTTPDSAVGIYNSVSTAPYYGALIYGSAYGVWGALASDPYDHYGQMGSVTYGVYGRCGASDETGFRSGGRFYAYSQDTPYGVYSAAYGYGSADAYAVRGSVTNYDEGDAYGGYFSSSNYGGGDKYGAYGYAAGDSANVTAYGLYGRGSNSTGPAYGVYGLGYSAGDYAYGGYFTTGTNTNGNNCGLYAESAETPLYAALSTDKYDHYALLGTVSYGVYSTCGNSDETSTRYGVRASSFSQEASYGVYSTSYGYGSGSAYGIRAVGDADDSGAAGNGYGAYLAAYSNASAYGLYVTAGTKSWVNPDPEDPTKSIVYATLEGGENGTYWRGTARLENGMAEVIMPDHFRKTTSPDYPVTVALGALGECNGLMVAEKSNEKIIVKEFHGGTSNAEFDFIIMGKRRGYENYDPMIENVDYVPFEGNNADMDESDMTTQEFYDKHPEGVKELFKQSGILDKEGKVNDKLFEKNGWKINKEKKPKEERP